MKKILILLTLLISNSIYADTIGFRASGGVFDYSVSGTIRSSANIADEINVQSVLGWQDDQDTLGYVYIEHPIPVIPNIRVGFTSLKLAGTGTTPAGGFDFGGTTFPGSTAITSSFDMSHTEIALYYEVLDNVVSLDLGINAKLFDGDVYLAAGGSSDVSQFDGTVPMLYLGVAVSLPLTGLSIEGDLSTIAAGDHEFTDYLVRVKYTTDFVFGVEVGYRSITLDFADTDTNEYADVKVDGPYAALSLNF
jgi:outer membrane protein